MKVNHNPAAVSRMRLFRWNSEFLKQYSDGDIIVMAETADEARNKARVNVGQSDAAYMIQMNGLEALERDLEREPEVIDSGVLYIEGSE